MNVLWPHVTHEQELAHRTRNMSFDRVSILEGYGRDGVPAGVALPAVELGVVECCQRMLGQNAH